MGNLFSVCQALEHVGARVDLTADPAAVAAAERLVLPGVGAFPRGMAELASRGLIEPIHRVAAAERPLLGICLGLQLLATRGEEYVDTPGLDLIAGDTIPVPPEAADGRPHRVPHTGWNAVRPDRHGAWDGTALADVATGSAFYFVHAFHFVPRDPAHRLAVADYDGRELTAAAGRGSILGCQFHPEKSGPAGLGIFRRFMAL
ncbi:MAG: imidazole glycerol phosphate synthase subunit HisH [Rhodobacterales bacterium]|nr:imidazole glycerol phosphate synthase subunit HisH [Rhodobacterales bacterium]